jgi:hypothetical protein
MPGGVGGRRQASPYPDPDRQVGKVAFNEF